MKRERELLASLAIALTACEIMIVAVRATPATAGVDLGPDQAQQALR